MIDLKVYCQTLEETAQEQLDTIAEHEAFVDAKVRIMPDAHAGAGCVIGFTGVFQNKIIPNLVGVDIGCGMYTVELTDKPDFLELDNAIRRCVPSGFDIHLETVSWIQAWYDRYLSTNLLCYNHLKNQNRFGRSLGTLGGGNHFIEVELDSQGKYHLVVHSGSRNLGLQVANYYQGLANKCVGNNDPLNFLTGDDLNCYLHDVNIVQDFASANRCRIVRQIAERLGGARNVLSVDDAFHTVHNYVGDALIVRKGAVSAYEGEPLLIPMNMGFGSLYCKGKGNADWNYSAPHGAGRVLGRKAAQRQLDMEDYQESMSGVWSKSVSSDTIDESPMAYKAPGVIIDAISDTVEIVDIWRSVYNFKAGK